MTQPTKFPTPFTDLLAEINDHIDTRRDPNFYYVPLVKARDMMLALSDTSTNPARDEWVSWLLNYGPGKFYDAFVATAQDAQSVCANCDEQIYLDIVEGGGIPDWRTADGDYGCNETFDTTAEETCGSHIPVNLHDEPNA